MTLLNSLGYIANSDRSGMGTLNTQLANWVICFNYSCNTSSTNSAALSAIRLAPQLGQNPRRLQLKATSFSCVHSSLMVIFSLLAVPIALFNELNHGAILIINSSSSDDPQYVLLVRLFLELHEYGIIIAQIFWGLWLIPMGLLIVGSKFIPRILGLLMLIAGVGYVVDVFNWFVFPQFEFVLSAITFLGEILLPLWLLFKGVDLQNWRRSHHV